MKELLRDTFLFSVDRKAINESIKRNNGLLVVEGVIQRADAKNQNGRIYPRSILEREVDKYKEAIGNKMALGELDHPDSSVINLKNVSHNITDVWWKGNDVMGRFEILETPSGNILKKLFEAGVRVGVSSRGLGSVKNIGEGTVEVDEDFDLLCWDFVSTPSTQGAIPNIISEGVNKNNSSKLTVVHSLIRDILIDVETLNKF